ncbi:hypothetical protein GCM10010869_37540 [Mesorhizobium tianshanense]|nr:hypothetical protein GCM10010869_37540 [Mesorhizobium tianshanense]
MRMSRTSRGDAAVRLICQNEQVAPEADGDRTSAERPVWRSVLFPAKQFKRQGSTLSGSSFALGRIHAHDPLLSFCGITLEGLIGANRDLRCVSCKEFTQPADCWRTANN